jgi:hypothetical protein
MREQVARQLDEVRARPHDQVDHTQDELRRQHTPHK